jgi:UDP-N-acetylglucosamine 2-epimerase (non-hydrolysing)
VSEPTLLYVVGARPNIVKMAPVVAALRRRLPHARHVLVHNRPALRLGAVGRLLRGAGGAAARPSAARRLGSHAVQTARTMERIERVLAHERPDLVIVPGDVNSTLAVALVVAKLPTRLAHLESGLRSFDRTMPEEINRIVADEFSDLLFLHSQEAIDNLEREGIDEARMHFVGNTMIDALVAVESRFRERHFARRVGVEAGGFLLVTLHRPALVDGPLLPDVIAALSEVARDLPVVFPVHPRTRKMMRDLPVDPRVVLVDPVGYLDFLSLEADAAAVLTDSGGVQEETTFLGVPCFTLRDNTERPVTIRAGTNTLLGLDPARIAEIPVILASHCASSVDAPPELWDGRAAVRVADVVEAFLASGPRRRHRADRHGKGGHIPFDSPDDCAIRLRDARDCEPRGAQVSRGGRGVGVRRRRSRDNGAAGLASNGGCRRRRNDDDEPRGGRGHVCQRIEPTTQHGSYSYMEVAGTAGSRSSIGYIRFDLGGLTGVVTRATLSLYTATSSAYGIDVHGMSDNAWQESSLTWNNAPPYDDAIAAGSGPLTSATWTTIDVTSLVHSGSTASLALTSADPIATLTLRSSKSRRPPKLDVTTVDTVDAGDTQPPSTPSGLTATAVDSSSIAVAWNASGDDVGVAGYDVYLNGNFVATTAARSYSFTGLACGTAYAIWVDAYDAAGNHSPATWLTPATGACAAGPVATSAPVILGNAQVGWTLTATTGSWSGTRRATRTSGSAVRRTARTASTSPGTRTTSTPRSTPTSAAATACASPLRTRPGTASRTRCRRT